MAVLAPESACFSCIHHPPQAHGFTKSAVAAIEANGGTCQLLSPTTNKVLEMNVDDEEDEEEEERVDEPIQTEEVTAGEPESGDDEVTSGEPEAGEEA